MKKILHSGQFLDYDGNTIKITFYQEKHLWVSRTAITAPYTGGEYEVEVWSDVGYAYINDSPVSWIKDPIRKGSYKNSEGHTVNKYLIKIEGRDPDVLIGQTVTATLNVSVDISNPEEYNDYDNTRPSNKTITISRQ